MNKQAFIYFHVATDTKKKENKKKIGVVKFIYCKMFLFACLRVY